MKVTWRTIDGLRVRVGGHLWNWLKRHGHIKPKPKPVPRVPIEGCDYVAGPTPAQLRQAGKQFVCRYLSTPGNPKNLTLTEAKELHRAGISIVLVFETVADRALAGSKAGRADAAAALDQADRLGIRGVPVYFAVDFDPSPVQLPKVVAYIAGAASVLGRSRVGVYGGLQAVKACHDAKACNWFWQTYAWSGGVWHPGRHIEQYQNGAKVGSASVDLDRAVRVPYGAWEA